MAEEENFFVGIREPGEFRKEVLETSKKVILNLKKYGHVSEIRREKAETIILLKDKIKEINALANRLREMLPKINMRVPAKKEINTQRRIVKEGVSELDKLETELNRIEKKIESLG